jgi:hypothetical protein
MGFMSQDEFSFEYWEKPGKLWSSEEIDIYGDELREVASHCFDEVPEYQCLTKEREELSRNVIVMARNKRSKLVGFVSAVLIDVDGIGEVLHMGLTCVHPEARKKQLTHRLMSRLLINYLVKNSPFSKVWVSNVACVVSSLGNVAQHFENIYPSPFFAGDPSEQHLKIAQTISEKYRKTVAINEEATLDEKNFVFRGSVKGSVFVKSSHDRKYFHRKKHLTDYYLNLLDLENGDEAVQIGYISLMTFPKYTLQQAFRPLMKLRPSNAIKSQA